MSTNLQSKKIQRIMTKPIVNIKYKLTLIFRIFYLDYSTQKQKSKFGFSNNQKLNLKEKSLASMNT